MLENDDKLFRKFDPIIEIGHCRNSIIDIKLEIAKDIPVYFLDKLSYAIKLLDDVQDFLFKI